MIGLKSTKMLLVAVLSLGFSLMSLSAQTLSSGCSTVNGFASPVAESSTVGVGTVTLAAGETIRFSGTLDDLTPMTIELNVTGAGNFTVTSTSAAATVQAAGTYTITITNVSVPRQDGNAVGSCQDVPQNAPYIEWSGYSDGRLDANPNEPFAVYCMLDEVILYEVPDEIGVITARYRLVDLVEMSINGELRTGNVILRRLDDDAFNLIFSGTNKVFSLADCYMSAGITEPPPPAPDTTTSFGIQVTICPQEFDPNVDCPDTDGDRVYDVYDDCPDDRGFGRLSGCPDTDGDGIEDRVDWCPDINPQEFGSVEEVNGCPDPDGDGAVDSVLAPVRVQDDCPFSGGPLDNNGCPLEPLILITPEEVEPTDLFTYTNQQGNFSDLFGDSYEEICIEWTPAIYGGFVCTAFD